MLLRFIWFKAPAILWLLATVLSLVSNTSWANNPGGFTTLVTAAVTTGTETYNGHTDHYLDNGILHILIENSGSVESIHYLKPGSAGTPEANGTEMVSQSGVNFGNHTAIYYYWYPDGNGDCNYSNTVVSGTNIDIGYFRPFSPANGDQVIADVELHYVLGKGNTGLYAYLIFRHPAIYASYATNLNISFIQCIWPTAHDGQNFLCENQYIDDTVKYGLFLNGVQQKRNGLQPSFFDNYNSIPVAGMPKEISQLTTGVFAGCTNGKYSYTFDYPKLSTFGMASDTNKLGLWVVTGGHEYQQNGPTACEYSGGIGGIVTFEPLIAHYGNTGLTVSSNANWTKIYGPWMFYFNSQSNGAACWADSQQQALAEKSAWPYAWLTNSVYQSKTQRASVSGKLVINDPLRPQASAAGAWIGLAAPDAGTENASDNWQFQSDNYQFWTQCAADGSFTLPPVTTFSPYGGNATYQLYAYCAGTNGSVGEFQTGPFTFTAGTVTNLGTLTWKVPHAGSQVLWEIGYPDRTAAKFRHGDEYARPALWLGFTNEFSNPLEYYVASNNWATAINYCHRVDGMSSAPWKWHLNFNLASVKQGTYWLNIAYATANSYQIIRVNNDSSYVADFVPNSAGVGDTTYIRQGIHAKYFVAHVPIPSSSLVVGANFITLDHEYHSDHGNDNFMYDYINLEAPLPQLTWRGDGAANNWDIGFSTNWFDGSGMTAYNDLSPVILDDTGSASPAINIATAAEPASVSVTANKDYSINGNSLYGTMALTKSGTGTLSLNNTNSYTGTTTISNGTLLVNGLITSPVTVVVGTLGGSGTVAANVAAWSGAALAPGKAGLPGTFTIANTLAVTNSTDTNGDTVTTYFTVTNNLALTNNSLYFQFAASTNIGSGVNDLIQLNGGIVTLAGTSTVYPQLINGALTNGTYTLISGGSSTVGSTANLAWAGPAGSTRQSFTLDASAPGKVLLQVTNLAAIPPLNSGSLIWRGTNGNVWDVTTTTNWLNGSAADEFYNFDSVTFNDTAATGGVSLAGTVQPAWVLVTNVSRAYTFSNGVLGGISALIKSGSGTLTLVASNSYSGGTIINAGTIALANDTANQYALGTGTVTLNGGTLAMYSNLGTYNSAYWNLNVPAGVTGTFNTDARCDLYGSLTGSGTLNLNIPSSRTGFHGDWSTFAGQINISGGDFYIANNYSYAGLGNAIVALSNNASMDFNGTLSSGAGTIVDIGALFGDSTSRLSGGLATSGSRLFTWRIGARNADSLYGGIISEQTPGTTITCLTKIGSGTLTLTGSSTYSGVTTISAGVLQVGNGGTAGNLGTNTVADSGTLAFNRSDAVNDTDFGLITGGGGFAQNGNDTFTFKQSQPYTGSTFVNAGTLALSGGGAIASSANIIVAGGAVLDVSGTTSGNLTLAGGQTLSGTGAVRGSLIVGPGATLAPGNPLGTLAFSNALALAGGANALFAVSHLPFTNGLVRVIGALTNGGSLWVTNAGPIALAAGDSFKLFSAGSYSGGFAGITLPALTPGLVWNTNELNTAGQLSVISIIPHFNASATVGTNVVLRGGGGLPDGNYYVLASTNVATPLAGWIRVATNAYDASGNFTLTNPVTPGVSVRLFRLQLP